MSTLNLVFAEIRYRFLNVLLSLAAVVVAATLFVAGPTLLAGYAQDTNDRLEDMQEETKKQVDEMNKKTRRIMRDLGVNAAGVEVILRLRGRLMALQNCAAEALRILLEERESR